MSNKPLEYENLKTVIQYLEPNLRILLARRIPSIRIVEKTVPLHLRRLLFDSYKTQVNRTVYRLGIYRNYPDGQRVPRQHQQDNDEGGIAVDLDEYGFRDWSSDEVMTPGDVDLRTAEELELRNDRLRDGLLRDNYEKHIEIYKKALAQRLASGETDDLRSSIEPDQLRVHHAMFFFPEDNEAFNPEIHDEYNEETMLHRLRKLTTRDLKEAIVDFQDFLVPYYCRLGNIPPPFTPLIQLTIDSQTSKQIHRFTFDKKIFEAWKSLNSIFFGNHRHVIRARLLIAKPLAIRLPVGIRIKIKRLGMRNIALHALNPIIEDSSFPLNHVDMVHWEDNVVVYENKMVKTAKQLYISSCFQDAQLFLPFLMRLSNEFVFLKFYNWTFPIADQLRLIEHWIETDKPVETGLVYYQMEEETCRDMLAQAKERFLGEMSDDRPLLRLQMNNNKTLVIFYNIVKEVVVKRRISDSAGPEKSKWSVAMRVVKRDVVEETATL